MKTKSVWTAADLCNNLVTKTRNGEKWLLCKVRIFNTDGIESGWIFVDRNSSPSGVFNEDKFVKELNECGHEPTPEPFTFTNDMAQVNSLKKVIEWENSDLVAGTFYRVGEAIYRISFPVFRYIAKAQQIHPVVGNIFDIDADILNNDGAVPVTIKFEDQEV